MEELNKKTLIEALSSLPEHEPNDMLWEQIEEGMEGGLDGILPAQLLLSLPQYEPPLSTWEGILKQLEAEKPSAKLVTMKWGRALAVAASLVGLLMVYWQMNRTEKVEMNVIAVNYSEEIVDPLLLKRDWNDDEAAFSDFLSLCEAKKVLCEQPEFKQLQNELEELTSAKDELASALGDFGTDANLVTQIKEIELERNDIVKKMMVMLI
ncbi:MAG: hypothetical protein K9J37_21390 [Saprospiraceae bacterium]|nr:hypothetical protein [Saprospiraceae bacterium]MCF8252476.1 hypothetical protein [Saprospiraceae bacterium]MCF8282477.1 hypothetical protein [Bacteroidales bacterium]MCF8312657.1 hypothetical protein [Saprospiraceae bacterium]MCF8441077.1 hypothetical protein [Saprospiraceae bacterium]